MRQAVGEGRAVVENELCRALLLALRNRALERPLAGPARGDLLLEVGKVRVLLDGRIDGGVHGIGLARSEDPVS